jgi:hypothetical protein
MARWPDGQMANFRYSPWRGEREWAVQCNVRLKPDARPQSRPPHRDGGTTRSEATKSRRLEDPRSSSLIHRTKRLMAGRPNGEMARWPEGQLQVLTMARRMRVPVCLVVRLEPDATGIEAGTRVQSDAVERRVASVSRAHAPQPRSTRRRTDVPSEAQQRRSEARSGGPRRGNGVAANASGRFSATSG